MDFWKRNWHYFIDFVKYNKKTIITNYLVFLVVFIILILIDLLTKQFLFIEDNAGKGIIQHQNWLFGIRSVKNQGLTFSFNDVANIPLVTFFNVLILLVCLCSILFFKSWIFSFFIAFIFTGSLGNTIDRLAFGYVRDIIFFPWADKGTFNFADVDVIVGSGGLIITMFTRIFIDYFKTGRVR